MLAFSFFGRYVRDAPCPARCATAAHEANAEIGMSHILFSGALDGKTVD
jgi:hypothetical protein